MNDKTKIIGACVLILGGVGVWAPQLPQLLGGSKGSLRTPRPAESEAPLDMPGVDPAVDEAPQRSEGLAASNGAASSTLGDPANDPLSRIEALLLDDREGNDDGLQALARSWQQTAQEKTEVDDGEPSELSADPKEEEEEDPGRERPQPIPFNANLGGFGSTLSDAPKAEIKDPFDTFIAEYPLSGLILGEKRQLASFGPYTLEVGDFIPGTNAKLERIERRSVVVSKDRKEFSISLPPFRSKAAPTEDQMPGALPDDPEDTSAGGSAPASAPSSSIQPAALTGDDQS